jgi:hypothetical protein
MINDFCGHEIVGVLACNQPFHIGTLEGGHIASVGDWIIKGVKGEFYPCKPDIFDMTYSPALSHPTPVQGEALPVVENDDADSAMHGACDPKFWQRATLEWKKIVRELNEKAIALGFESAHQCIDEMPVFERALSLQETHLDKHVATINELRTQLSTALAESGEAVKALRELKIRYTGLFNTYDRPTYRDSASADRDLQLALETTNKALARHTTTTTTQEKGSAEL